MFPKDLVVFLEPRAQGCGPRLTLAAALAHQWSAQLIATFVTQPLVLEPHLDFAVGPALSELLAEHRQRGEQALARARGEFEAQVGQDALSAQWRVSDNESFEAMMQHARHACLAIVGPPARQRTATTMLGLAERMIFASGRPTLLVPDEWTNASPPQRVVIGWNGGREATRAIADAMPFLLQAQSVDLVVVLAERPDGAFGQDAGADMAAHLARQGVRVTLVQRTGDEAGRVLLEHCAAHAADLLVMGAIGRPRISEILFGGATRTVLGTARLPVLLSS